MGMDLFHLNRGNRAKIEGVKNFTGDINSKETHELLKGHEWDVVVNFIAFGEEDIERDIFLFKGKTSQYIFISSASVYQKPPSHPVITESTPAANPFWQYSRNKIQCEERLMQEYRDEGFPITIVRPSHTYDTVIPVAIGGWEEFNIIDRLKKGKEIIVHGDGASLWTITHSEDFAKGIIGLFGHQQVSGHIFHITSDEILTWNQIYEAVADAVKVKPKIVHISSDFICNVEPSFTGNLLGDKSYSAIFDNTKIKTFVPDFKAVIPFKKGILRTLKWFDDHPEKKIINPATEKKIEKILDAYHSLKF